MKSIQDVCRDKKDELRLTAQMIADESGVPLSTVNKFFAGAVKNPNVETLAPICMVLGISLDEFYGINASPDVTQEQALAHEREKNEMLTNIIKQKNRIIGALLFILILALIYGITLDMLNPNMGLFRY